jgi:hypothetical protein
MFPCRGGGEGSFSLCMQHRRYDSDEITNNVFCHNYFFFLDLEVGFCLFNVFLIVLTFLSISLSLYLSLSLIFLLLDIDLGLL